MTTAFLAPNAVFRAVGGDGLALVGGQLFTYAAGTTTPIATYTDNTAGTPNTNPIILNSRGEANVWILPNVGYKFQLEDATSNIIWTVDQIFNSQLLTLFGGVDTGSANNYILTFSTPFTSYTNGEVIYFIPSFTNSGPSTLNVNGLGVIPIVNINGTPLGAGQITAGQTTQVMYYNGSFQLLSIGSFTGVTIGTFGAEAPIASASTTDLGTLPAHVGLITGTNTITSFGNSANTSAPIYHVRYTSALTVTFNAVSLILPGNADIVTQPGDAMILQYLGNGNWKCTFYQTTTGSGGGGQNSKIKPADTVLISTSTLTPDPDLQSNMLALGRYSYALYLVFDSVSAGAGFKFTNDGSATDSRGFVPGLTSGFINNLAYGPKSETFYGATVVYPTVSTAIDGNQVLYTGSILVGVPGTFGISWAQNASTGSATTLRAGSYLILTLLSTGSSQNVITHVYSTPGTFVETIPTGFTTATIEVWGGSGGGAAKFVSGPNTAGGGGGASGSYAVSTYSVTGLGGDTLNFTVGVAGVNGTGPGGDSSVSSGTMTIATMTGPGGPNGSNAVSPGVGGAGGVAPAIGTGGTVNNVQGNAGSAGASFGGGPPIGGNGANGIPGINGGGNSGGHGAGNAALTDGGVGFVIFSYSP
jgi:hypothetical protein